MRLPFGRSLDAHAREVVRGASAALVLRVAGAALTFGLNVLIARLFGASGSGAFFLALTIGTIATVAGRMGLDNTLLRFVAAHAAAGEWEAVAGVSRLGIRIAASASVTAALLMAASAPLVARRVFDGPDLTAPILWMAVAVPGIALGLLYAQLLRALKRVAASMMVAAVWLPVLAGAILLVTGRGGGAVTAVQAYAAAAWGTAIGAWAWWRRATPMLRGVRGHFDRRTLLRSSTPLLWVASMTMAMNWIATFALGAWGTVADVGVFNAASRVAFLVGFVLIAVDSISAPKFAALYRAGAHEDLARLARTTVRPMALLAAPALLVIVVAPGWIMGLFGPEFVRGAAVLVVLALAQATGVVSGSVGSLLLMSGHERQVRDSNTIAAAVCLAGCLALVPRGGALGAAVAVTAGLVARNVYEVAMVRRHLGIGPLLRPAAKA